MIVLNLKLDGRVISASIFQWVAIARFICCWQYVVSCNVCSLGQVVSKPATSSPGTRLAVSTSSLGTRLAVSMSSLGTRLTVSMSSLGMRLAVSMSWCTQSESVKASVR